ncbi:MAG: UvrD-helicase domain-containing protein [Verrucomicrobiota bacterium]|nr:UvrD-helicase domain-containing protein [Verrucomicrobiota bacterium]
MSEPHDQAERVRFATELDRNFSVVASAGSGKTRAVTDRIAQLAKSRDAVEALPRLVVLTFANRAADEMQQRAREEMLRAKLPPEVLAAFNRAWFGTIHAFCFKLLNEYGHYLGLPAPLELLADDDDLWTEFVQQQTLVGRLLSPDDREKLLRLASLRHIMELGRSAGSALLNPDQPGECPKVDLPQLRRAFLAMRKSDTVANSMAQLEAWADAHENGSGFLRWPNCFTKAKQVDVLWAETFAPLRRWVNQTAICVAAEVQRDYRNFRLERGVVTYADQIALADELLQHPEAARRLRQLDPLVILDEAQDTDPAQFSALLEITRPPEAIGRWLQTRVDPPRPGRFCMVGDFQQSIWHSRADLAHYRRVHEALVRAEAGDALTFSVTFRLDRQQIDFINDTFRHILDGGRGQVDFVELQPRPNVLPGQVIRIPLGAALLEGIEKPTDRQIARIEAEQLAAWLQKCGPEKLRARSWRDVAILCPRKDWLNTMAIALRRVGLPIEVQSEADLRADSPAYAWLTALCTIMVEPQNHYEIVGVLRELYGLADADLALFAEGVGERFQIEKPVALAGVVGSVVAELAVLRESIAELPLFAAVEQLIARTALRARLATLPDEDFKDPLADLETLITAAAQAGATGARLVDFAERLRNEMEYQRTVRLSDQDAIQLITAHKAKGLEWDAVIVPFLGRRIVEPSPSYPSLIRVPGRDEVIAALHKEDREAEIKEAFSLMRRQEMERLLYVALTRSRHTLVLALDRGLFSPKTDRAADYSQLKFLRGDEGESSIEILDALPEAPDACEETRARWGQSTAATNALPPELAPLDDRAITRARERASAFLRKQNPSGLEEPADTQPRPHALTRKLADTPATLFGAWWHALFEHLPWKAAPEQWQLAFETMQPSSPDAARSAREWPRIAATLRDSPEGSLLRGRETIVQTEVPFLLPIDEGSCLEGVIDLLATDRSQRRCLLIDWKTNHIAAGQGAELQARYRSQLAAYWKAVTQITGYELEVGLFSTALGEFLMYDPEALAAEWARLTRLPADRLHIEVSPDQM